MLDKGGSEVHSNDINRDTTNKVSAPFGVEMEIVVPKGPRAAPMATPVRVTV